MRERETDRQTDRDKDIKRDRERDRERQRERERKRGDSEKKKNISNQAFLVYDFSMMTRQI